MPSARCTPDPEVAGLRPPSPQADPTSPVVGAQPGRPPGEDHMNLETT